MKSKDLQFGIFAVLILGLLAVIFMSFVEKARAASSVTPTTITSTYDEIHVIVDDDERMCFYDTFGDKIFNLEYNNENELVGPLDIEAAWRDIVSVDITPGDYIYVVTFDVDFACGSATYEEAIESPSYIDSEIILIDDSPGPDPEPTNTLMHGDIVFSLAIITSLLSFMASSLLFGTFLPKPGSTKKS